MQREWGVGEGDIGLLTGESMTERSDEPRERAAAAAADKIVTLTLQTRKQHHVRGELLMQSPELRR